MVKYQELIQEVLDIDRDMFQPQSNRSRPEDHMKVRPAKRDSVLSRYEAKKLK